MDIKLKLSFITAMVLVLVVILIQPSATQYTDKMLANELEINTAYAQMYQESEVRMAYLEDIDARQEAGEKIPKQDIIDGLTALNQPQEIITAGYTEPKDLFYTCLATDGCYVSQSDSDHFEANGYMATDVGTNGSSVYVHAPDYHNKEVEYTVKHVYYPDTTGKTIELFGEIDGVKIMWRLGHLHPEGYEFLDGATVKTGDVIAASGGETELDDQGVSTGMHVHVEFLLWDGDKYAPTPYRIADSINKHNPDPETATKQYLTTFYLSGYNLGDVSQNDASPCIGASGKDLCEMLNSGKQVIAMTSDKRSEYGVSFGDIVYLDGDVCQGYYYVEDEMNARYGEDCLTSSTSQDYCIKGDIAFPLDSPVQGCVADIYKLT